VTSPQHPGSAATRPPLHDVAHLGHVELLTPEPEASLRFFTDVLGLTENGREGNSVYLRTWDDYEQHTVKLTAHDTSGIRRVGLRASSQQALEARVGAIEAAGLGISWKDGDPGSVRRTCSATRTGTSSSCTGKPVVRAARRAEAGAEEPGSGLSLAAASACGAWIT
jgi:catechol 2,3-dioxygenase-like lactoylglutathione lyase family enzyme